MSFAHIIFGLNEAALSVTRSDTTFIPGDSIQLDMVTPFLYVAGALCAAKAFELFMLQTPRKTASKPSQGFLDRLKAKVAGQAAQESEKSIPIKKDLSSLKLVVQTKESRPSSNNHGKHQKKLANWRQSQLVRGKFVSFKPCLPDAFLGSVQKTLPASPGSGLEPAIMDIRPSPFKR
jgi:hypothetical protein